MQTRISQIREQLFDFQPTAISDYVDPVAGPSPTFQLLAPLTTAEDATLAVLVLPATDNAAAPRPGLPLEHPEPELPPEQPGPAGPNPAADPAGAAAAPPSPPPPVGGARPKQRDDTEEQQPPLDIPVDPYHPSSTLKTTSFRL